MSLAVRLALLLTAVVGATVITAWLVAGRAVLAPFAREAIDTYLDEVVYVADQVESGTPPDALGAKLGLEIEVRREPPRPPPRPERLFGPPECRRHTRGGHEVIFCPGRRAPVSVKTASGWVVVRRELDVGAPRKKMEQFLVLIALGVIALSVWIAVVATRPLSAAKQGMARIAAGELSHRLPEQGPKELREAASAFNAMAARVEEMLRTERALMAGMSHELRTPLARLRLEAEMLRDRGVPEGRVAAMEADLSEMDELIGELLEMSRLELGERRLARGPVELSKVAAEAVARTPSSGHEVVVEGASRTTVLADHDRLVRVVSNLIANAAKYAPQGSRISVRVEDAAVEVRDQGPGVPESALPRLFEPFFRGGAAGKKPGLGLGLMIAQQVVALHGGRIWARNQPEGGLAVRFELPAGDSSARAPLAPSHGVT